MPLFATFPIRLLLAAILVWLSLMLHTALGTGNPVGDVIITLIFVVYTWAAAAFKPKLLGWSVLYALPAALVPPIVLLIVIRKILDPGNSMDPATESWIIGVPMALVAAVMAGLMYKRGQA